MYLLPYLPLSLLTILSPFFRPSLSLSVFICVYIIISLSIYFFLPPLFFLPPCLSDGCSSMHHQLRRQKVRSDLCPLAVIMALNNGFCIHVGFSCLSSSTTTIASSSSSSSRSLAICRSHLHLDYTQFVGRHVASRMHQ